MKGTAHLKRTLKLRARNWLRRPSMSTPDIGSADHMGKDSTATG